MSLITFDSIKSNVGHTDGVCVIKWCDVENVKILIKNSINRVKLNHIDDIGFKPSVAISKSIVINFCLFMYHDGFNSSCV